MATIKYDMNHLLTDKEEYAEVRDSIFDSIQINVENRRKPVVVIVDGEEYEMTRGNLLTLLICYRVFLETKCKFSEDFLFDPSDGVDEINKFMDHVLEWTLYHLEEEDFQMVKEVITLIISDLANVSGVINTIYGNTISIKSLIDLGKRNPEFHDLMRMKLPEGNLQFNEIEGYIKHSLDRTTEILSEEENVLQTFIASGSGINLKQLGQVVNMIGNKPDLDGTIIPIPIESSFIRGIDVPSYFIVSKGCRKALITNSTQVKSSGYLNRKATIACLDEHSISKTKACDTKHLVPIHIFNKSVLKRLNGRWYRDAVGQDQLITPECTFLVGKTLDFYSPATCACDDGICERCYGSLSKFNRDINIGVVAVLLLTEPLTQRLVD